MTYTSEEIDTLRIALRNEFERINNIPRATDILKAEMMQTVVSVAKKNKLGDDFIEELERDLDAEK